MDKTRELHLFIVWSKGLRKAEEIVANLASKFTVLDAHAVHWSEGHFSSNFSRFHGRKLSKDAFMEEHCGRGPFLAITVADETPLYDFRQTSRGRKYLNTRCFDAETQYRQWTGYGQQVQASLTAADTKRDLMLLLHRTVDEYPNTHSQSWNGEVRDFRQDILGADGWTDLSALFGALNVLTGYTVIRNWEDLTIPRSNGLDLDLLCEDPEEVAVLANAGRLCPEPYRSLYRLTVAGVEMPLHFRSLDENYFDPAWARDMLRHRELSAAGFYHLNAEDYFYSLLYHAAVHNPRAAFLYRQRLLEMPFNMNSGIVSIESFADRTRIRGVLEEFFKSRQYRLVEPNDLSVDFDYDFTNIGKPSIERITAYAKSAGDSLAALFDGTEDCSIDSEDFQKPAFRSQKAARHFSRNRAMFLEALELPHSSKVLQIGTESGIVSRWLGEHFSEVVALEDDVDLLRAASRRCRTMDNVRVLKSDDKSFKAVRRFDVAVAIVDERQVNAASALGPILRRAKEALKQSGLLIVGLDVHPNAAAARNALTQQLKSYGFSAIHYFCAFPNVILPQVVLSDEAVRQGKKSYGYWAAFALKAAGIGITNELQVAGLSAEGKVDQLAPGCYFLASRDANALPQLDWQACAVSSQARPARLRSSSKVIGDGSTLTVHKSGLPLESGLFRFRPCEERPLFEGHSASAALTFAFNSGDLKTFLKILKSHASCLTREFQFKTTASFAPLLADRDTLLRGEALDAVPRNAVLEDDSCAVFDLEWQTALPIPLSYVLYRGLIEFFGPVRAEKISRAFRLPESHGNRTVTTPEICLFFIKSLGLVGDIKDEAVAYIEAFEARLHQFMSTGQVATDALSLFEKYHLAIALYEQGRSAEFQQLVAEIRESHPAVWGSAELVEEAIV
jgi:precorrin-6B methylase 2